MDTNEVLTAMRAAHHEWTDEARRTQNEYYNDSGTLSDCADTLYGIFKLIAPLDRIDLPATVEVECSECGKSVEADRIVGRMIKIPYHSDRNDGWGDPLTCHGSHRITEDLAYNWD